MSGEMNQEIETKFNVKNINNIKQRLELMGAQIHMPRVFEINYRFDTQDHKLSSESKVLRLRQDSNQWITFKGPGKFIDGIRIRQEIEFSIGDIERARAFLEALGYQVYQSYEKYRTVYVLNNSLIMLDELPFGTFVEIENTDLNSIKLCAEKLDLNWEYNIDAGYLTIYRNLCEVFGINFGDLTFKKFVVIPNMLRKINISPADQ